MATPREGRKSRWIFGALVALALVAGVYLLMERYSADAGRPPAGAGDVPVAGAGPDPAPEITASPPAPGAADATVVPIDIAVLTPAPHIGQPVTGAATVVEVPSRGGFWIERNDRRLFVLIAPEAGPTPTLALSPGQHVRLSGVLYDRTLAGRIPGEIEPGLRRILESEPAFVVATAENVRVVASTDDGA